jgi:hypothetical protein
MAMPWRWFTAKSSVSLSSLDRQELLRLAGRLRAWSFAAALASCPLFLVAASARWLGATELYVLLWFPGTMCSFVAVSTSLYSSLTLARAVIDRNRLPVACKGNVHALFTSPEGGWPLLIRDQDGRWLWLTGREPDLTAARNALGRRRRGFSLTVQVTLTYYPTTHVIKEVKGTTAEEREMVPATVRNLAPNPA